VASRRYSTAIFRKFSVKVIRLAEGPQVRNFTLKIVCYTRRPARSSVITHWTSSLAISERRILISFILLMERPRFCTIRDVWLGVRGRKAKRPSTPVWISSSHGTARSRLFMSTSTRRPHRAAVLIKYIIPQIPCGAAATSQLFRSAELTFRLHFGSSLRHARSSIRGRGDDFH